MARFLLLAVLFSACTPIQPLSSASSASSALVAPNSYCIVFPGQTFVPGDCDADGYCVVADAPAVQASHVSFDAAVYALDGACYVDTTATGTASLTWYGFDNEAGDGTFTVAPASLAFTSGVATATIYPVGGPVTPYFDDGSVYGVSADADESIWTLTVTMPTDSTAVSGFMPSGVAHSNSATGEIGVQVTNHTGGGITVVEVVDLDSDNHSGWAYSTSASQIWNAAGSAQITTGWTKTIGNQGRMVFTADDATVFPDGATLRFQPVNASGLYPNIGTDYSVWYNLQATYHGYQSGYFSGGVTVYH